MNKMPPVYGHVCGCLILKAGSYPGEAEKDYWTKLYIADTLKYRFSDMPSPTVSQILPILDTTYYVWSMESKSIVGEFTLYNFSGSICQIHFSMAPDCNARLSMELGKAVADVILTEWKIVDDVPYVTALVGVTPMPNRPARLFISRAGYRKLAIIPNGTKYLNKVCDALLTIREDN